MSNVGASIFLTGDALKDPALSAPHSDGDGEATLSGLSGFGANSVYADGVSTFPVISATGTSPNFGNGDGFMPTFSTAGHDVENAGNGSGSLPSIKAGTSTGNEFVPNIAYGLSLIPGLESDESRGRPWTVGTGEARLSGVKAFGADVLNYAGGISRLPVTRTTGRAQHTPDMLWVRMPRLRGTTGDAILLLEDTVNTTDVLQSDLGTVIREVMGVVSQISSLGVLLNSDTEEAIVVRSAASAPYYLNFFEDLGVLGELDVLAKKLVEIASELGASDSYVTQASLVVGLSIAAAVAANVDSLEHLTLADVVDLASEHFALVKQMAEVSAGIAVASNEQANLAVVLDNFDTAGFSSSTESIGTLSSDILESAEVFVRMNVGGDVVQGWVVNTKSSAFSEYDNFPFDSVIEVSGTYYAVADDGLYEITGDNDQGEQIDAFIKTGLLDMGSHFIKDAKSAYIGFSTDGRMLMKVTTTQKGRKEEWWYELKQSQNGSLRDGRVTIGRGLRAKYWQFEIANVDGADFELDDVQLMYNVLSRRVR